MLPINLLDYEVAAQQRLDPATWDYIQGGSCDELTLRANCRAYGAIHIRPRVLTGAGEPDLTTTVQSTSMPSPLMIAPLGCQRLVHPAGERATAAAAGRRATLMVASTMSNCSLEEIRAAGAGPLWFQLYIYRDRRVTEDLVRRAETAGYCAIVVTVDTPRLGRRERDLRNGFGLPADLGFANFQDQLETTFSQAPGQSGLSLHSQAMFDASLRWDCISWLRSITSLPLILKGILTAEDALLAVEHGVDGIIVSNHGGRQLDSVPASISVLPEIVSAAGASCELYLDGGIRRGSDVFKALALGARAVLLGRPVLWGLAVNGEEGVMRVLDFLQAELELTMLLAGAASVQTISRSMVCAAYPGST